MTATRQAAAQANSWSVENLELQMTVLDDGNNLPHIDATSFILKELKLEGAALEKKSRVLVFTNDINTPLPPAVFAWKHKKAEGVEPSGPATTTNRIRLPVYLSETRTEFLFAIDMDSPSNISQNVWYQRGLAITVTSY